MAVTSEPGDNSSFFTNAYVTRVCLQGAKGAGGATAGLDLLGGMAPLPGVLMPGLMPGLASVGAFAGASRIVVLKNAVEVEELSNTTDYEEIVQDMQVRRGTARVWCSLADASAELCSCSAGTGGLGCNVAVFCSVPASTVVHTHW
jgi:hypothetical protein